MKISRIYRGKKSNRINIDVDEEFKFSVEEASLIQFNLFVGKEIDERLENEIKEYDQFEYLYTKAIGYIARRPRSEKELLEYLEKKSEKRFKRILPKAIKTTLESLKDKKYLDDREFAKWFADTRLNQKKYSSYQIKSELSIKFGVNQNTIEEVLEGLEGQERTEEAIDNLINKKYSQYKSKHKSDSIAKEKMIAYLSSKGFGWEDIKKKFDD